MAYPGNLVSVLALHRAESAAQTLNAQLRAFEALNDEPGMFTDDLTALQDLTNRIVAVRDSMPRTLVQVGQLTINCPPALAI